MEFKKIDFDNSFKYFKKDKQIYEPKNCHINVYDHFYSNNCDEVDSPQNGFKFVTGYCLFNDCNDKRFMIHSWVERQGKIIDVTVFANSEFKESNKYPMFKLTCFKNYLVNDVLYLGLKYFTNLEFTLLIHKETGFSKNTNEFRKAMEAKLLSIIDEVNNDKEIKNKIIELGYKLNRN